MKIITKINPHY